MWFGTKVTPLFFADVGREQESPPKLANQAYGLCLCHQSKLPFWSLQNPIWANDNLCKSNDFLYNEITWKPHQHNWFNMIWFQPILTQIRSITAVIRPFNWQAGIVLTQQLRGKQTNPICWFPHVSHHDCACSSRTKWNFKFCGILRGDLTTPSHHKPSPISV